MPATPSQLRRPIVVNKTVDFGEGVEVTFRYDRNKITDNWLANWTDMETNREGHAMNEVLADLLESWDIVNDDGTPYPLTVEALGYLFNIPDKMKLISSLITASMPSDAEGKGSASLSSTVQPVSEAPQPTPQNGQATSESPSALASPSPM